MNSIRSHLTFNRSQRDGILSLVALILVLLFICVFVDFSEESALDDTSSEVISIQRKFDSLRALQQLESAPKQYAFNPNFMSDFKAYTLGMSPTEYDRLVEYRQKDQWINSIADFKRVTQVSDSLLNTIGPLLKFPDWVSNPKSKSKYVKSPELSFDEKLDLNLATTEALETVSGIGAVLSSRIVRYREKLGGFSDDLQLYEVYGLNATTVDALCKKFTVKTPKSVTTYNVNTASASDIATIPGIDFDLAKKIWEFVHLREGIADLSDLLKIEEVTEHRLRRIALYLYAE